MFLQTERTCSSGSHCCYRGTSGRPLTALNGRTPAKPRSCWQTEILHNNLTKFSITCRHLQNMLHLHQNYKNRKFTLSFHLKIHSYIFLCCNLLYLFCLFSFCSSIQGSFWFTVDSKSFATNWTLPQNILSLAQSKAGDSRLNDICAHFLRKSVRKLNRINRMKCILVFHCHIPYLVIKQHFFFCWPVVHMVP